MNAYKVKAPKLGLLEYMALSAANSDHKTALAYAFEEAMERLKTKEKSEASL